MSFGSISSLAFSQYCGKFFKRDEIIAKLTSNQLKLIAKYNKWVSAVRYKEIMATSKIGNDSLFCGITNSLDYSEKAENIECEVKDSKGNVSTVKLADIGANESEIKLVSNILNMLLTEVDYLCYIKDNNYTDKFEAKRYDKLGEVLDELWDSSRGNEESAVAYCFYFKTAKLPLTMVLVDYYRNELYELYEQKIVDNIADSVRVEYNCSQEFMDSIRKSNLYILELINSYLRDDIETEKKRAVIKLAIKFKATYDKLSNGGKTDFVRLVDASKQTAYYVTTALGERLATKNEIKSIVSGVYKKDFYYLSNEKRSKLLLFGWCVTGDEKYYMQSNVDRYRKEFDRLEKLYEEIWNSLTWLASDEFLTEDLKELAKGLKEIDYPDVADDEIKEGSLVSMLKYIQENGEDTTRYGQIALDIAEKCIKYKTYDISEKQYYIVKIVYDQLVGKETPKENNYGKTLKNGKPNLFNDELFAKISKIAKHKSFKRDGFVAKVIGSVVRYKKCSEKQYNVLMEEYSRLGLDVEEAFNFGSGAVEIDTTNDSKQDIKSKASSFFIDDEDDFDNDKNINETTVETTLGSLMDISNSLGLGGIAENE